MTFARIAPNNFPAIAEAERLHRLQKPRPDLRGLPADQRAEMLLRLREDPHEWTAIVRWCRWWAGERDARRPCLDLEEADHLAAVTLRTAAAALRRWHADGRPGGEAEARAFKLLYLARKFAAYVGAPTPGVDATGAIIFPFSFPERNAA